MTEYLQELQDLADSLRRLPGLLTAIVVLQILMLLAIGVLIGLVARMGSAMKADRQMPPTPTPAHLNPFVQGNQPMGPYGTQQPYQQGQQGYPPQP